MVQTEVSCALFRKIAVVYMIVWRCLQQQYKFVYMAVLHYVDSRQAFLKAVSREEVNY